MAHNVKCTVCGKTFDRDKVQAVKVGARRYAHYSCCQTGELVPMENPVEEGLLELEAYIQHLLGEDYNRARVNKQIKEYKTQYNYTYTGMLKTLTWFYEIKGNSKEKANGGIGIIPFVYKDACNYYYSLYMAQIANDSTESFRPVVREIEIVAPEIVRKPPKLFNVEDDE